MAEKNKKSLAVRIVLAILVLIVIIRVIQPVLYFTSPELVDCSMIELDDGWDLMVRDTDYGSVKLSETLFDMTNRGDVLTLTRTLPEAPVISSPVMRVYSVHAVVDVYLDDERIYSFGHENYEKGKLMGYGQNLISLPHDYAGKTVKILFTVTENDAVEGIPCIYIYDGATMMQHEIAGKRISLAISLFLMMFGLLGMCLSLYMLVANNSFVSTFCMTLFTFLVGLWTLCNADMITFFSTSLRVKVYLEYISFYTMLLPLLGYFLDRVRQPYCKKWIKTFYYALVAADVVFITTVMILQLANIVHYPVFVRWNHLFIAATLVFILCEEISAFIINRKAEMSLLVGFGLAIVVAAAELFRYNLRKYVIGFKGNVYDNTIGYAVLIVVIALLADFASKVTKNMYADAEQRLLQKLAYMDELTGLANRRKCEDAMKELEDSEKEYAIISMDMNKLKHFNDTYGHDCGDLALKAFADLLGISYPNSATVGRMGGDEFIVILPDTGQKTVDKYLSDMENNMDIYNKNSSGPIYLSTAYGSATSKEADSPHAVYTLADARMYEHKRAMKAGRKD